MKVMGVIVAMFSIGGLVWSPVFSAVMALVAGGLLAYHSGIEFNFRERTYRSITAIGTQGFGAWQPLPALTCVSIFRTTLVNTTYGRSNAGTTSRQEVLQVNLATAQNTRIRLLETEHSGEAVTFCQAGGPSPRTPHLGRHRTGRQVDERLRFDDLD
jgi:hypothetical protein